MALSEKLAALRGINAAPSKVRRAADFVAWKTFTTPKGDTRAVLDFGKPKDDAGKAMRPFSIGPAAFLRVVEAGAAGVKHAAELEKLGLAARAGRSAVTSKRMRFMIAPATTSAVEALGPPPAAADDETDDAGDD